MKIKKIYEVDYLEILTEDELVIINNYFNTMNSLKVAFCMSNDEKEQDEIINEYVKYKKYIVGILNGEKL